MAGEVSTIQSLKAVDAWIDVINSNINGGVRTAFKASRLKFGGSNTNVDRAGTTTSLPLQFPEPSLVTQNTIIDFTQGAVTASTENSHLAIQGTGWFLVASSDVIDTAAGANFGGTLNSANARFYLTRDGEFRTNQFGLLVNSQGYVLVTVGVTAVGGRNVLKYDAANVGATSSIRAVYNNIDGTVPAAGRAATLTSYLANGTINDVTNTAIAGATSILKVTLGQQSLEYTQFGSTVFDFGFNYLSAVAATSVDQNISIQQATTSDASILGKSLEASNASMTQSVPELSLAQKLFSALTKVLQTKQTNIDGVINLIR
jgi:flagellar hook protein FlgE